MAANDAFRIQIHTVPLGDLDTFALCACQDGNFGNKSNWFGLFRGGLYGFYSRVFGVERHYQLVHNWQPTYRYPTETEYHISSIFFGMDSAIECFVFMLNALGYAAMPHGFWDVVDPSKLKKVKPEDILGGRKLHNESMRGYNALFPQLQTHWINHRELVSMLMDLHDVSKHRQTIYSGGQLRLDPPPGFYEMLDAHNDPSRRTLLSPHAEILVKHDPKGLKASSTRPARSDHPTVEKLVEGFCGFIERSCVLALDDARANIKLPGRQPDFSASRSQP